MFYFYIHASAHGSVIPATRLSGLVIQYRSVVMGFVCSTYLATSVIVFFGFHELRYHVPTEGVYGCVFPLRPARSARLCIQVLSWRAVMKPLSVPELGKR